jgi:plasmid maintenance system antidote protein VapI
MASTKKPRGIGKMLKELFMEPNNLCFKETANCLGISKKHLEEMIYKESYTLSSETAAKLAVFTDTTIEYWIDAYSEIALYHAQRHVHRVRTKSMRTIMPKCVS